MKTYYDGEEREILGIEHYTYHPSRGDVWLVIYRRGDSQSSLLVPATDELDAMRKFPAELERLSKNEESNKC